MSLSLSLTEVQRDISHELPDWLQEFRENLVDESTSTEPGERNREQGSQDTSKSSHELPMPRAHVEPVSGKHNVKTRTFRRIRIVKFA